MEITKTEFKELFEGGKIKSIIIDESSETINTDFIHLAIEKNGVINYLHIFGDECLVGCVLSFELNCSEIFWKEGK